MDADEKICVLLNLKLDSKIKVNRLHHLLKILSASTSFHFLIRVRGEFSNQAGNDAHSILEMSNSPHTIFYGEVVSNWKLNTYLQLQSCNCEYILTLNEDHFLVDSIENLMNYLLYCRENMADVGVLAFPQTFFPLYTFLSASRNVRFLHEDVTYDSWEKIPRDIRNYPVSLVGFYKRSYLEKILLSRRPLLRHYPFNSPFEFEQSGQRSWIFPLRMAIADHELFGCVDDDGGITGSSLIARGIWVDDMSLRVPSHHKKTYLEHYIEERIESDCDRKGSFSKFSLIIFRKIFNLFRMFMYSTHGLIAWDFQKFFILRRIRSIKRQKKLINASLTHTSQANKTPPNKFDQ
jgi:hypothetical protein